MNNPWRRSGLSYYARVNYIRDNKPWTVKYRLGWVSYHLIRWIHGEAKLIAMGHQTPKYACVYHGFYPHFDCAGEVKMRIAVGSTPQICCCEKHYESYIEHWNHIV